MSQPELIKTWINSLLSSGLIKPDDVELFCENLNLGLLQNNKNLVNSALDELTNEDSEVFQKKLNLFTQEMNKTDENPDIEQILKDYNETSNVELKRLLLEAKTNGNIKPTLEFIERKLAKKKILVFQNFVKKFDKQNTQASMEIEEEEKKEEKINQEIFHEESFPIKSDLNESPKPFNSKLYKSIILKTPSHSLKASTFYVIYESFEDSSSEYKMNKIKFNLENFELMLTQISKKDSSEVIGFYGSFLNTMDFLARNFDSDLNHEEIQMYLNTNKIFECLLAFSKGSRIILFFLTNESIYNFASKADSNLLAVLYIRYLIDLCRNIFIIPPNDWLLNPNNLSPFMDEGNSGKIIVERLVEPSDKIKLHEIPLINSKICYVEDLDMRKHMFSSDFSKFITKAQLNIEENFELNKQEVNYNDIKSNQNSSYYYNSYSNYKRMDYLQIKTDIEKYWVENNIYFTENFNPKKFEEKARLIFKNFVQYEHLVNFEELLQSMQKLFDNKKAEIEEKYEKTTKVVLNPLYDEFFTFINENNCKKIVKPAENAEESGFLHKVGEVIGIVSKKKKPFYACSKNCVSSSISSYNYSYYKKFTSIDWKHIESTFGYETLYIHRGKKKIAEKYEKLNKELEKLKKEIEENKHMDMKNLRIAILKNFFEDVEQWIIKSKINYHYSYSFQFQSINIIRNTSHEIENWNVNQAPFVLNYKFGKDANKKVFLKNIYFLEDNCGIILFSNYPENKSSLIYFNVSNKQNPILSPIMNLSSPDCNLIIEKNMNLWCVYDNREKRFNIGKISGTNFDDGLPLNVYEVWKDGICIREIISASFLTLSDSIFLINQDLELFELKYLSKSLNLIWKKENKGAEGVVKSKILPKTNGEKYFEIQCTLEGKNIILRSKSCVDIYDLNWSCIHSIPIDESFLYFKTFNDKINNFLIFVFTNQIKCYHFIGLTATKSLEITDVGEKKKTQTGNPIFDYIYVAFQKFGPHSYFIGSPMNSKGFFYTQP